MYYKANLAVRSEELTVYFHINDGDTPTPCHYCRQPGYQQLVVIESVERPLGDVDRHTKLFREAKAKLEQDVFSGRSVCNICDPEHYIGDMHKNARANGTIVVMTD